jgi:hypothetical protein
MLWHHQILVGTGGVFKSNGPVLHGHTAQARGKTARVVFLDEKRRTKRHLSLTTPIFLFFVFHLKNNSDW